MCDELGTALRRMRDKDYDFMIELLCLRVHLGEPLVGWCCLVVFLAFRLFFGFFFRLVDWHLVGLLWFLFFFFVGGSCFVVFCFYAEKEERRGVYCIFFSSAMI